MPAYSTGMSQPPKATIFAPDDRCLELSGVFLSGAEGWSIGRVASADRGRYYVRSGRSTSLSRSGASSEPECELRCVDALRGHSGPKACLSQQLERHPGDELDEVPDDE